MIIKRKFVEHESQSDYYEPVETEYCCDVMEEEIKGVLADIATDETDHINFLNNEGTVGLEKTARKNVPFESCPFCGSDICTKTVDAVRREVQKVQVTKEKRKEVELDIKIPEDRT